MLLYFQNRPFDFRDRFSKIENRKSKIENSYVRFPSRPQNHSSPFPDHPRRCCNDQLKAATAQWTEVHSTLLALFLLPAWIVFTT